MTIRTALAGAALLLAFTTTMTAAEPDVIHRVTNPAAGRYIIVLRASAPAREHAAALAAGANARLQFTYEQVLNGFSIVANENAARALSHNPNVQAVWEASTGTPADAQYAVSDGLDRIDQINQPLNDTYLYNMHTTPVRIYIVDTGVNPQPEFASRIVGNINFVPSDDGTVNPADYDECGSADTSTYWHGTASMAIAGGATYGVAKWAKLVNVRTMRCFEGTGSDILIRGIDWVTSEARRLPAERHVGNLSVQFSANDLIDAAVIASINAGVAWASAAGNNSGNACANSPGRIAPATSGLINVGSMNPTTDAVESFSNQGDCVEIFAPTNVQVGHPIGGVAGGTSASAPHVAGVFAIRIGATPTVSAGEIEGLIKGYATPGVLTGLTNGSPNLLLYSFAQKRRS